MATDIKKNLSKVAYSLFGQISSAEVIDTSIFSGSLFVTNEEYAIEVISHSEVRISYPVAFLVSPTMRKIVNFYDSCSLLCTLFPEYAHYDDRNMIGGMPVIEITGDSDAIYRVVSNFIALASVPPKGKAYHIYQRARAEFLLDKVSHLRNVQGFPEPLNDNHSIFGITTAFGPVLFGMDRIRPVPFKAFSYTMAHLPEMHKFVSKEDLYALEGNFKRFEVYIDSRDLDVVIATYKSSSTDIASGLKYALSVVAHPLWNKFRMKEDVYINNTSLTNCVKEPNHEVIDFSLKGCLKDGIYGRKLTKDNPNERSFWTATGRKTR